ncbi:leucine-rich repeat and coiled-coil domain-containing protein 1 isoform X2 [Ornithorhynchus anatinus]|uniref:leucine-rich repeat and coiled-coil domain-containing protein 1 isoform X2 n=1 Tax=Ornithorhynchus anatinus TaxID=9258 RepID=UPI0010A7EBA8|nr:leucine-rich repeat and coiled-coil domain-containing protein 1 isoform X2 [Ornithorhynchus anatinus]
MAAGLGPGDLCLIDRHLRSLLEVSFSSSLHTINLHCNHISKIESLDHVWNLQHLDLSSNQISQIEGLSTLTNLRTLNLSCNLITKVEGLEKLFNLTRLNLSFNRIHDLHGFLGLHGTNHKISHIDLHGNCLDSINHLVKCMTGLHSLTNLTLEKNGKNNPLCDIPGYRGIILQTLPQLKVLDGMDVFGEPINLLEGNSSDLQYLEDLLDYLVSSDSQLPEEECDVTCPLMTPHVDHVPKCQKPANALAGDTLCSPPVNDLPASEPQSRKLDENDMNSEMRIKKLEDQISQLLKTTNSSIGECPLNVLKGKRETDTSSESDCESGKENHRKTSRRTKITNYKKGTPCVKHHGKGKLSDSGTEQNNSKNPKHPHFKEDLKSSSGNSDLRVTGKSFRKSGVQKAKINKMENTTSREAEESTYKALVQELDQERERRWKAEQTEKRLSDQIKELQKQAREEKDLHSITVTTTDRLKELVFKERNAKMKLQAIIQKFQNASEKLTNELNQSRLKEEEQQRILRDLEEKLSKMETQRVQQQASEMKRVQELELKTSATERELQILRVSLRQQKEKVQQLHEILALKEQQHRKELESRVTLNGSDFKDALAKEIAKEEKRHEQHVKEFQQKINTLNQQYLELENEFRIALTIEAKRFKEAQQKEKQTSTLIQDLTSIVKEQKAKIAEVSQSKLEATSNLKKRIQTLETMVEEDKEKTIQVELLKQEKSQLISQLTAQESIIDGLRAERKLWGQELAQQGASLAQDRGKLEAKIEVLSMDNESLRKQNERDSDALRIKTKIVDDQTETIRKLKEGLQDRDERLRRLQDEINRTQKAAQEQLDGKTAELEELMEKLERHRERKEELKQQLQEKEEELEEITKSYSAMNKKWQEKGDLLNQLEAQVKQMKEKFDTKEKKLIEERDKNLQAQKVTLEKLHSMDNAFRRQLDSMVTAHQVELVQLASEKQKQIEAANEKVYEVEEEMRQLLQETANNKRAMEEKMKRLTCALNDIQQEF